MSDPQLSPVTVPRACQRQPFWGASVQSRTAAMRDADCVSTSPHAPQKPRFSAAIAAKPLLAECICRARPTSEIGSMVPRKRRAERAPQYGSAEYAEVRARLSGNVRALRAARGWTQEQAAEACELAPTLWQAIEAGRTNATLITLARLARGLAVDPSALIVAIPTPLPPRRSGRPRKAPQAAPSSPAASPPPPDPSPTEEPLGAPSVADPRVLADLP